VTMTSPRPGSSGRIFISYRRDDAPYQASWLFERLAERFGGRRVFKDINSIQFGDDFAAEITAAVGTCAVLLVVIGDRWLTITDDDGRRRIDDPTDWVRLEIETALKRNIRVIPVLLSNAKMPRASQLPDTLAGLARRQALPLSPERFDTGRLEAMLEQILALAPAADDATGAHDREDALQPPGDPLKAPGPESAGRTAGRDSEMAGAWEEQRPPRSSPSARGQPHRPADETQPGWRHELPSGQAGALVGRAAQRGFVDNLAVTWQQLADSWASLVTSAADLADTAVSARPGGSVPLSAVGGFSGWLERATSVSTVIGELTGPVRIVQARAHRDGVVIGVVGQTGAGKTTLVRKLSGLGEDVLPSNRFSATTATLVRVFHEPGAGPGRAVLKLHTWESFRAAVLVPLHRLAEIAEVPLTLDEFRHFEYGDAAAEPGAVGYHRRLRLAQASLPSYQDLLKGGAREVTLERLGPFVAYPEGDLRTEYRPYHGVRSVDVFCEFPEAGTARLGLIDLPGTGEGRPGAHELILTDLRKHADALLIVTRPEMTPFTDWDTLQLADAAAAGVRRSDFVHQLINRDHHAPNDHFSNVLAQARADGERLGIDVRECDIKASTRTEIAEIVMSPLLRGFAGRLAYMDRDAAAQVLSDLAAVAAKVPPLADEFVRWAESRQAELPDEEQRLRMLTRHLRNDISLRLHKIRGEYEELDESRALIADLDQAIAKAARDMRQWLEHGFGVGSAQEWLRHFETASAADPGEQVDYWYNAARMKFVAVFSEVDASLGRAVDGLWGKVADALRSMLTETIVPAGPDNHGVLADFAKKARMIRADTLAEATERLLYLRTDYGSIFLRIGWPVARKIISWVGTLDQGPEAVATGDPGNPQSTWDYTSRWHARLTAAVERAIAESEIELSAEVERAQRVLAAAVDLFYFAITATPDVEVELERITGPVRQRIWPDAFGGPPARLAAELADLRERAAGMAAAAGLVDSFAEQASRLKAPGS
jgi:hypothetical protein